MNATDTLKALPIATPGEGTIAARVEAGLGLRPSPLDDRHFGRLAIVYVRQSDPQQVLNHIESRERQYALVDLAAALGWPRDRILLIDEDQGNRVASGVRPSVRSEKVLGLQWVQFPPGNWVAPAGSYRSGGGGNETVGAFETDVSPWRCSEPTGRNASER